MPWKLTVMVGNGNERERGVERKWTERETRMPTIKRLIQLKLLGNGSWLFDGWTEQWTMRWDWNLYPLEGILMSFIRTSLAPHLIASHYRNLGTIRGNDGIRIHFVFQRHPLWPGMILYYYYLTSFAFGKALGKMMAMGNGIRQGFAGNRRDDDAMWGGWKRSSLCG